MEEFKNRMAAKYNVPKVDFARNSYNSNDPLEVPELDWAKVPEDEVKTATLGGRPLYLRDMDAIVVRDSAETLRELTAEERKALKRRAIIQNSKYAGKEKALHIN